MFQPNQGPVLGQGSSRYTLCLRRKHGAVLRKLLDPANLPWLTDIQALQSLQDLPLTFLVLGVFTETIQWDTEWYVEDRVYCRVKWDILKGGIGRRPKVPLSGSPAQVGFTLLLTPVDHVTFLWCIFLSSPSKSVPKKGTMYIPVLYQNNYSS